MSVQSNRQADARPSHPSAAAEIEHGQRFAFGRNWASFLKTLDESRIQIAVQSLTDLLGVESLSGQTFLDVGGGSGLFSLAARRLDARVHSLDYDEESVACAEELKRRYFPEDDRWSIAQGSVLDKESLASLGKCDVVYSWGVLHHTGNMWQAVANVADCVKPGGLLAIALYNDQGWKSSAWRSVKQCYCANRLGRMLVLIVFIPWFVLRTIAVSVVRGRNEFATYRRHRGMSIVHDWIDWLGGLPFEVATPQAVAEFLKQRGFQLVRLKTTRRLGCNEFVLRRPAV